MTFGRNDEYPIVQAAGRFNLALKVPFGGHEVRLHHGERPNNSGPATYVERLLADGGRGASGACQRALAEGSPQVPNNARIPPPLKDHPRYEAALRLNLQLAYEALLQWECFSAIGRAFPDRKLHGFFALAHHAHEYTMLANLMRILDRDGKSATFWYIQACHPGAVDQALLTAERSLADLSTFADVCKRLRNADHFHLDKGNVLDPASIWNALVAETGDFEPIARTLAGTLAQLLEWQAGQAVQLRRYKGEDLQMAVQALRDCGALEMMRSTTLVESNYDG